jgi:outer membrane protein assembly factor BamA
MLPLPRFGSALAIGLLLLPALSSAQDSREAALEKQRADKATALKPYEPGKLEKGMLWYEEHGFPERLQPHDGFYVGYGYNNKVVGSGFGVGAGYRHDLFGRTARMDVGAGISFRNYQMLMADFSLPYLADDRFEVGGRVVYQHHPQEDYWGLGMGTPSDNRVSYTANYTDFQGRAIARPTPWLQAGARFGRVNGEVGAGKDRRYPSIEEIFTDPTAPGLDMQPDYGYTELFAAVDYRDQPGNARAGGLFSARWRKYNDLDLDRYSFREVDVLAQHFFPIWDKKRVFAAQARFVTTDPDSGQQVPFYFMPTVGGSNSLRSYADFRFRDQNVLYFNVEYRWEAFSGLDMALFYDRGVAAPTIDDLSLSDAEDGYGIGFRFNTYKAVFMRFDIGFGGNEGVKYYFKFSRAF